MHSDKLHIIHNEIRAKIIRWRWFKRWCWEVLEKCTPCHQAERKERRGGEGWTSCHTLTIRFWLGAYGGLRPVNPWLEVDIEARHRGHYCHSWHVIYVWWGFGLRQNALNGFTGLHRGLCGWNIKYTNYSHLYMAPHQWHLKHRSYEEEMGRAGRMRMEAREEPYLTDWEATV